MQSLCDGRYSISTLLVPLKFLFISVSLLRLLAKYDILFYTFPKYVKGRAPLIKSFFFFDNPANCKNLSKLEHLTFKTLSSQHHSESTH